MCEQHRRTVVGLDRDEDRLVTGLGMALVGTHTASLHLDGELPLNFGGLLDRSLAVVVRLTDLALKRSLYVLCFDNSSLCAFPYSISVKRT